MQDVVFIALVVLFFAIAVGAVQLCDRIVRSADVPVEEPADQRVA
jgi:hypothetical protein